MIKVPKWIQNKNEQPSYLSLEAKLQETETKLRQEAAQHEFDRKKWQADTEDLKMELALVHDWMEAIANGMLEDVPSITKQHPWPAAFYNFGTAEADTSVRFFNCGLMELEGQDWLVTRRARSWEKFKHGMNDIVCFKLEDNKPCIGKVVQWQKRYKDEHFEDPRASIINGNMFLSCTNFQILSRQGNRVRWSGCHQVVGCLMEGFRVPKLYDPEYANNGATLYMQDGKNEKNWLWFEHNGAPHCVYMTVPHIVLRASEFFEIQEEFKTDRHNQFWTYGTPRGGTPPVRVGDEYFSFFHSSLPWFGWKRRYFMGAYAFEAKPPFTITRMSTTPILIASKQDPWVEGLPLVVFPCGALLRDNEWLVTLGVNDYKSAWVRIPHAELVTTLRKLDDVRMDSPVVRPETETTDVATTL